MASPTPPLGSSISAVGGEVLVGGPVRCFLARIQHWGKFLKGAFTKARLEEGTWTNLS